MTLRKRSRQSASRNARQCASLPVMIEAGSRVCSIFPLFPMAAGDPPDTRMIAFFAMDKSPLCALCG